MGGSILTQVIKLLIQYDGKGVTQLNQDADQASGKLGRGFGVAQAAAIGFAGAGLGAVGAGLVASVKSAGEFEASLNGVKAATGASAEEMSALRTEALAVGKDTSKSASESVAAFGELTKAGVSVSDVVAGVGRTTVQLAEATGTSVSDMAALMSNTMNTFHLPASQAAEVANTLSRAANASAIDIGDMGQSLAAVGPVAANAGLTTKDFATAIGILGNNALKGADGGTSLKAVLMGLTAPTDQAAQLMENLGIQVYDSEGKTRGFRDILGDLQSSMAKLSEQDRNEAMKKIFGTDGIRAATILMNEGVEGFDKFGAALESMPSVAEQSATRLAGFGGEMEKLKGSIETAGISIGSKLLPALTDLASGANKGLSWLMDRDWSSVGNGIGRVADMIGNLGTKAIDAGVQIGSKLFGSLDDMEPKLNTARDLVGSFVDGVLSAIEGKPDPFAAFVGQVDKAFGAEAAAKVQGFLDAAGEILGNLATIAQEAAAAVLGALDENWQKIKPLLDETFGLIGPLIEAVTARVMDIIGPFLEWIGDHWRTVWEGVKQVVETQLNMVMGLVRSAIEIVNGLLKIVIGVLTGDWRLAWEGIKQIVQGAVDAVQAILSGAVGLITAPMETIKQVAASMATGIASAVSAIGTEMGKIPGVMRNAVGDLAGWAYNLGASIAQGIAKGITDFAGQITGKLLGGVQGAFQSAQDWLRSRSPSERAADELGEPISTGVALGVERKASDIARAAIQAATAALEEAINATAGFKVAESSFSHSAGGDGGSLSMTSNKGGLLGLSQSTFQDKYGSFTTMNASAALRAAAGGRSGEAIFADLAAMGEKARQAWIEAMNPIVLAIQAAQNPASITHGMTPAEIVDWYASQQQAAIAAATQARAAAEANLAAALEAEQTKPGTAAGSPAAAGDPDAEAIQTQIAIAADAQQQAAQKQAEAAQQQVAAAASARERQEFEAQQVAAQRDLTHMTQGQVTVASYAAAQQQVAADNQSVAASDQGNAATEQVEASIEQAAAAVGMTAATTAFAEAVDVFTTPPSETDSPEGIGNLKPPDEPPTTHAAGGWLDRFTLLSDAQTGRVFGTAVETGRPEAIVPEDDLRALVAAALGGASRSGGGGNTYVMPPSIQEIHRLERRREAVARLEHQARGRG